MALERFDVIGSRYITSNQECPHARDEEWHLMRKFLPGNLPLRIIDFACGAGFLTERLIDCNSSLEVCGIDTSKVMLEEFNRKFSKNVNVSGIDYQKLKLLKKPHFELLVCLGGFHHILDPVALLRKISKHVKAKTELIFVDFEDQSDSQHYFDTLIHQNSKIGHIGLFISQSRAVNLARASNLTLKLYERSVVNWRFNSQSEALQFVRQHHGLDCTEEQIETFLSQSMLVRAHSGWEIRHNYAVAVFST